MTNSSSVETKNPASPEDAATKASPLTAKQQRFVDEYLIDMNATQAAIRAGYSVQSASEQSYDHLRKPQIQAAIAQARQRQQQRTEVTADRVILEAWQIATADPRELVQVKVGCCRYCWGEGHKRQRTLSGFNSEREKSLNDGKSIELWDPQGGIGYSALKAPHPRCPECHGDGEPRIVLCDARQLSPAAASLFAGARQTKYGIEIQMHSKLDALEKLARHLGLYEKDNRQHSDPLSNLLHTIAKGNGNAFVPVAVDPEKRAPVTEASAFSPRRVIDDEDD